MWDTREKGKRKCRYPDRRNDEARRDYRVIPARSRSANRIDVAVNAAEYRQQRAKINRAGGSSVPGYGVKGRWGVRGKRAD
jgi:hypothetical protein